MSRIARRSFLATSMALPSATHAIAAGTSKRTLLIGTQTAGIYRATFDAATGALSQPEPIADTSSPTFLARHGSTLYAVNEVAAKDAAVSAFRLAPDGGLTFLNKLPAQGSPAHISVHPSGKAVYIANYGGGSITTYSTAADGSLAETITHIQYQGEGPNPQRQEAAHAHAVYLSPDNRFLLVNDLGLDTIHVHPIDPANPARLLPELTPLWKATPGSGPRHLAFSPKKPYLYNLNELGNTIDLLAWDAKNGTLKTLGGPASTLADTFHGKSGSAEIALTRDGKFCYTSNRGEDTIACFTVSPIDHGVTFFDRIPCGGKTPRHFTLSPDERYLLTAGQDSANITVLRRNRTTGKLSPTKTQVTVPSPMMLLFL